MPIPRLIKYMNINGSLSYHDLLLHQFVGLMDEDFGGERFRLLGTSTLTSHQIILEKIR